MIPTFPVDDDRPGLTVVDPVQNKQYPLKTAEPVSIREADPADFTFPVDAAVEFSTTAIVLPYVVPTYVRDRSGEMVAEAEHYAYEELPADEYVIEVMAPVRLYVRVHSRVLVASSDERLEIEFGSRTRVRLGARSHHDRPAGTVETTAAPADLARAVSTFGSALKTTSCERSLPTLRGHPPRLTLGDRVRVPEGLEAPATGVSVVVPPRRTAVYAVSSLAYYLGATVRVGERPRIETDRGFEHPLGETDEAFERSVERVLAHVLTLDCVVRTEGLYELELYERERLEERVDLDLAATYDAALADQLETYLSIPFETVADLVPRWHLVTDATSAPENLEALPFLVNELSFVRAAPGGDADPTTSLEAEPGSTSARADRHRPTVDSFVSPPAADAFERAWLGEGTPIGANKLIRAGFEHGLGRTPSTDSIEITLVCNEPRMAAELEEGLYGGREELPFEITVHSDLAVDELRALLGESVDFLHYVGHAEDGAFVCRDGALEASALEDVGVETFLINGCQSYEIGARLIEAGGVGGIVTLSTVTNADAIAVGRLLARLLNAGFTLRSAVSLARSHRIVGNQYVVVGDGGVAVTQAGGGASNTCRIEPTDDGRYRVRLTMYHTQEGTGGLCIPYLDTVGQYYLAGKTLPPFELTGTQLYRFFQLEQIPVEYDGTFHWSSDDRFDAL
ncbi:hypothetical protein [Natrononativus amylolyticus]|uniref:hypothetical protein n=1 Tax=Natrononativus amylolyticus TaxID=2963434 RepID=UPI0020CBF30D|nr:hypothetical protein [Natrononativus amylolyticus]